MIGTWGLEFLDGLELGYLLGLTKYGLELRVLLGFADGLEFGFLLGTTDGLKLAEVLLGSTDRLELRSMLSMLNRLHEYVSTLWINIAACLKSSISGGFMAHLDT